VKFCALNDAPSTRRTTTGTQLQTRTAGIQQLYAECVAALAVRVGVNRELSKTVSGDKQIDGTVIEFVAIPVMDYFPGFEPPPKFPFCHQVMNQLSGIAEPFIASVVDV